MQRWRAAGFISPDAAADEPRRSPGRCDRMLLFFLHFHKVLHADFVDNTAERFRHKNPQAYFLDLRAVGIEAYHQPPRLGPILLERRRHQRIVASAQPQVYPAKALQFAFEFEFQFDSNLLRPSIDRADFDPHFLGRVLVYGSDLPQGETRSWSYDKQYRQDGSANERFHVRSLL